MQKHWLYLVLVGIVICSIVHQSNSSAPFHLQTIHNASGIYFHRIGSAKFFSQHWELVSYFDLTIFNDKFKFVNDRFEEVRYVCDSVPNSRVCPHMMSSILNTMNNLSKAHEDLINEMTERRARRSIFTGGRLWPIGWLSDSQAMGTTYTSDYYDEVIDGLVPDTPPRMNIIRANYSSLDQRVEELERSKNEINIRLNYVYDLAEKHKLMLSDLLMYMNDMARLAEMTRKQFGLLSKIMLFEKSDVLDDGLFTKVQFINELKQIGTDLISSTRFVYPLDEDHVDDLIKTSKFIKFFTKNKIVFVFQVPLGSGKFKLYNVLPLTVFNLHETQTYAFINPSFPYFSLSYDKSEYALMRNLEACQNLDSKAILCKNNLVYSMNHSPICEGLLIQQQDVLNNNNNNNKTLPRSCLTHYRKGNIRAFHALTTNRWLIVSSTNITIHINCTNNHFKINAKLTNILTVRNNCDVFINGVYLMLTKSFVWNNLTLTESYGSFSDFVPSINIWADGNSKRNFKILPNITDLISLSDDVISTMGIRFRTASFQLEEKDANEMDAARSMEAWFKIMLRILGAALSIVFLYLTWQLCATINLNAKMRRSQST